MKTKIFTESYHKTLQLNDEILKGWMNHSLFTLRWWLGICLIIVPLLLWLRYRKKDSADRLQYAGLFVALISASLDYMGTFFGRWKYDYEVFPALSNYIPFSFFCLPIAVMFLLQIKPNMNPFIKALLFSFFSIIALPIVDWIGIYDPIEWKYIYSFFIQYFVYLVAHYLVNKNNFNSLKE